MCGGKPLERKSAHVTLAVTLLILALNLSGFSCVKAEAAGNAYTIDWVNHNVEVLYNGYVFINDTLSISGAVPTEFYIGFPYQYGSQVLLCIAYDNEDPSQRYNVTLDVPFDDRLGFYGVKVELPRKETPHVFNIGFLFS
ncbi:MAG: hypothetical protein QXG11_07750, partial [Candidatus Bathyarchaeia archaeon]